MDKANIAESKVEYILDLFKKTDIYRIPNYQRKYVWTKERVSSLFQDIMDLDENNINSNIFLGTTIVKVYNQGEILLIDGQQRFTTFTLLFKAMSDFNFENGEKFENKIYEENEKLLNQLIFVFEAGSRLRKLKISDLLNVDKFKNLLNSDPISWDSIKTKNQQKKFREKSMFHETYLTFRILLQEYYEENKTNIISIILKKLQCVWVNKIVLKNPHDELRIFESINSKGTPLKSIDLIKNFYFMELNKLNDKKDLEEKIKDMFERKIFNLKFDQTKEEKNFFSKAIRIFIIYQSIAIKKRNILLKKQEEPLLKDINGLPIENDEISLYSSFKIVSHSLYNNLTTYEDFKNSLRDLKRFISTFNDIKKYSRDDIEIQDEFILIMKNYNQTFLGPQFLPVIMQLYNMYCKFDGDGEIYYWDKELQNAIKYLERFIVLRYVTGKGSRLLTRTTNGILFDSFEEFQERFNNIGIPLLDEVNDSLRNPYLGENLERETLKAILARIEYKTNGYSNEGLRNAQLSQFTIEHILPQNPSQNGRWLKDFKYDETFLTYKNRFGNLTISQDNSKLGNKEFQEKRKLYSSSKLEMNRNISKLESWTTKEIDDRTNQMIETFNQIWFK